MSGRLSGYVLAHSPKGESVLLGPDDKLPDWAATSITNDKAWAERPDTSKEKDEKPPFPEGDPSDSWKVDELKAYAESKSIDLGDAKDATTKAPILEAIEKAAKA